MNKPLLVALFLILIIPTALAQVSDCGPVGSGYRLCVPFPGQPLQVANLGDYVRLLYQFALAIAGIVVFIRIVYGGVLYSLSAGNTSKQLDARATITQAIWGLLLLLAAALILYTINPDLIRIRFRETYLGPPQTKLLEVSEPKQKAVPDALRLDDIGVPRRPPGFKPTF